MTTSLILPTRSGLQIQKRITLYESSVVPKSTFPGVLGKHALNTVPEISRCKRASRWPWFLYACVALSPPHVYSKAEGDGPWAYVSVVLELMAVLWLTTP